MLTKLTAKNTDGVRRQALQLAVQLPADIVEAREVIVQTEKLLESFMIPAPHEIWNRPVVNFDRGNDRVSHRCALSCTMLGALVLSLLGAAAAYVTGGSEAASGCVLMFGVSAAALIFGQVYGVIFSFLAALGHNLFAVPPVFEFTMPNEGEIIRLVAFVALALALPVIATWSARMRAMALSNFAAQSY